MALTRAELSKYNGKNGNPAYVAYEGRVYDISHLMQGDTTMVAGLDLTDQLDLQREIDSVLRQGIVVGGISDG